MHLLVGTHPDDLARGIRQPAEPVRDRLHRAGEAGRGLLVDLVAGREIEGRVAPQGRQRVREGRRAQRPCGQRAELRVDPRDLRESDAVELHGVEVERGVDADEAAVAVMPALHVAHAGPFRGPRGRQDLGHEGVVEAGEGRPDLVLDGATEGGGEPLALRGGPARQGTEPRERRQQRPVLRGGVEEPGQDGRRPLHRCAAGDPAVGKAAPERGEVRVRVARHRTPARHHVAAVLGRLEPLVVGDVEEVRRHAVERVHVPCEQPGIQLGDVGRRRLPERVARDPRLAVERAAARRVRVQRVQLGEQAREPRPGRRDARVRRVREAVVMPPVADGRGEQRMALEDTYPSTGRRARRGGFGASPSAMARHRIQGPTLISPCRPIAGTTRSATVVGVRA